MENFARHEFDGDVDKKVKQELQIAKIPVKNFCLKSFQGSRGINLPKKNL